MPAMSERAILEATWDGPMPPEERAKLRSLQSEPHETDWHTIAAYWRDTAIVDAKLLIRMRRERGQFTDGARRVCRERLKQALQHWRAARVEIARLDAMKLAAE